MVNIEFLSRQQQSIEGHGDCHPQPHPDPLHVGVLAHPAPPCSPHSTGRGVYTLPGLYAACTTDLTMLLSGVHHCIITIINLFLFVFFFFSLSKSLIKLYLVMF